MGAAARTRSSTVARARLGATLLAGLLVAACATMRAGSDYYPDAEFTAYATFAWAADSPLVQPASRRVDISPLNVRRIREAIEATLTAKGLSLVAERENADIALSFTVGARDIIQVDDYPPYLRGPWRWGGPYYGANVDVTMYTEGTLAVDVFDNETRQPVWHGWARKRITGADVDDPETAIRRAVSAIFAEFPPGA